MTTITDTNTSTDERRLADEFTKVLRDWLSEDEFYRMQRLNTVEENPGVCHSHDFCDANMAMEEAFQNLGIPTAFDVGDGEAGHEAACELWNHAWEIAAERYLSLRDHIVICNGFEGQITKVLDGQLRGMVEVSFAHGRGAVCVDVGDITPARKV